MNIKAIRSCIALILMSGLLSSVGCLNDPEAPPKEPGESNYGDLTQREHTIGNMVQSYADRNIERYAELLHEGYLWYMQPRDVEPGGDPFCTREADIAMTRNMFLAAAGQYAPVINHLELVIDAGDWHEMAQIGGVDCEDGQCWQTEREYHITVQIGETTYLASDLVIVSIIKDSVTQKYSIMRIYDTERN